MTDQPNPAGAAASDLNLDLPTDAVGAAAKLAELEANKEWAAKAASGDPVALNQLSTLARTINSAPEVDQILSAVLRNDGSFEGDGLTRGEQIRAVHEWRKQGFADDEIRELLTLPKPTPENLRIARAAHHEFMNDRELQTKLANKDPDTWRRFTAMSAILAAAGEGGGR